MAMTSTLQIQFSVSLILACFIFKVTRVQCGTLSCNQHQQRQEFASAENRELWLSYRQTIAKSHVQCVRDCHTDLNCTSVNYYTKNHLCKLSSFTRLQFPDDFIIHYGSVYFDADVDTPLFSEPRCSNCKELLEAGHDVSGIYTIYSANFSDGLKVYCDMGTDGGGWIVIQRRQDGSVDFYRNWADYQLGFGNLSGEFWIGNDILRSLTESAGTWELRVDLEDWDNDTAFAEYGVFEISGDKYQLNIDLYSNESTAGDSLTFHNEMMFSTMDKDNDLDGRHCAARYRGAWWHNHQCYQSNLNGMYHQGKTTLTTAIRWDSWKGYTSVKTCEMKIRPSF